MSYKSGAKLVGLRLDGYTVQRAFEVFEVDEEGRKRRSIDFFLHYDVARGWMQGLPNPHFHRTTEVCVITNGERHFLFGGDEINIHSDTSALLQVRANALSKLTSEERAVLGL